MKKFTHVLAVLLVVLLMMSSVSFAEGISVSAEYKDGRVSWTVSGFFLAYDITVGSYSDRLSVGSASHAMTLTKDTKLSVEDMAGNKASCTVKVSGAVEPVETPTAPVETPTAPVETPTAPVETPTAPVETPTAPVETPTAPVETPTAPVETPTAPVDTPTAPATTAPATTAPATTAPATTAPAEDDEVPKTGDTATAAYLIGAAMVLAAAYLLLRRRVHSK